MRIITYNVNGIRAAVSKGFHNWLRSVQADVVCIQETKAQPLQIPVELFEEMGYVSYMHSALKKGYSGVAILSKQKPVHIEYGMGIQKYDQEGRVIRADYKNLSVMSVYHPSGSSGDHRQDFKMEWLDDFYNYVDDLKGKIPNLIISGDFNICHKPIDIHDPVRNAKSSGFLPEEREWLTKFLDLGYIDSFRFLNDEPFHYTWWSFRANARAKNLGWRIDYNMVSQPLKNMIKRAVILTQAKHSDHCPVLLDMNL